MPANQEFRNSPTGHSAVTRSEPSAVPPADRTAPLELSYAQQRSWFLAQMRTASEAHHLPLAVELEGTLDRTALGRALDALSARHEVLRTRFTTVAGTPFQEIGPADTGFPLAFHDLTDRPDAEERLGALQREEATATFDLARGPLARGRLIALGAERHVLLLTLHHSITDARSLSVLTRELGALYTAFTEGAADPLPPLSVQYADYAAWQRQWLTGAAAEQQRAYWQGALAGSPALLELITDRPRPAEQDFRGGRVPLAFDEELTAALEELARRHGCAVSTAVLAGWALTLSRLSGQTDVVIGTPTARRRSAELDGLIGLFANTLALRVDLSAEPTVAELLRRVTEVSLSARDHEDLPFEQVVDVVNPERSLAHTPLFQVFFDWRSAGRDELTLPGVTAAPLPSPYTAAKFDLTLSLAQHDGRVEGDLEYAAAVFDAATAERFGHQLGLVLRQMTEDPERPAAALTLLDEQERRRILTGFNDTERPGDPAGLVERFETQVRERPEQAAVVHEGEQLDFATLERRANRLAHALIARGVRTDDVVGLHLGLSVDLVVAMLGILKAGGAYLPLDPALPQERLAGMVADAGASLVLTDAAAPPDGWPTLAEVEAEGAREDAPGIGFRPDNLAYVIYTSGSTGRPKGVAATHRGILNVLDNWIATFGTTPGLPSAMWPSFAFDASIQEFLLPLTSGGTLELVPGEVRHDPELLTGWLRERRIVEVFLPPAYIKWFCEAPEERLAGLALRFIHSGLESLPEDGLHRLEQTLPGLRILYGYGPTETALYCTAYPDIRPIARQSPIGSPIANMRTYVLDERLQPVPVGVVGELYVAGAGTARCYLSRPGATAERFVADPFVPGERMYRSGDQARWLPEGHLVYAGRNDHQVKLRGFRIEPGEIEVTLLDQPGVVEAAVLADRDEAGDQFLVAAVGVGDAAPRSYADWRAALGQRLPAYMIPAFFVELPQLPLTTNGKLDRAALLAKARADRPVQVNQASPRDHIELALYRIWQRLLLQTEIGISDSFFDVGGTSISAIKLAHAVREEFGETLPVRDILQHPTIEALGERLRRGASGPPPSNLLELRAGEGQARVVCVHPAGGTAFCYLSLAKALPESVGVQGIQSPGVNPGEEFLPSVEAMAEAYLKLIEPLPDGPLVLTGLSYGGLVAHEMGRRLAAAGRERLSVVLLDTQATDDPVLRVPTEPVGMAEFRDKLIKFNGMYPGIDDRQIEQYHHIYNHNLHTSRDHVPASTTARTVLLEAVEGTTDEMLGAVREFWRRRAEGEYAVESVKCDHWEMLESSEVLRAAATIEAELARLTESGSARARARES
ncbi:non-ribosomal peptide synthetase [Streptomyces formicae]|uniref:Peptide synthetase n=1 Tax=Streptomyces formicae TaxID=1616117 RepID=A0A291Q0Y5_9ACTN|nr:non-ribosomal peptide synthetase [Streptomyces formicae]ATL25252.1 Peptide synthetase [Streptomyces formicae]